VHRIGRTGRAGHKGRAISFACPDQRAEVREIERLMRINLMISKLPELPPATQNAVMNQRQFPDERAPRGERRQGRPFPAARPGGRGGNFPRRRFGR
jgi:ATP-dependent RNA helicase RhlE